MLAVLYLLMYLWCS